MDIRKIKKLIEMVENSSISEIEITEEEGTIRISRALSAPAAAPQLTMPATPNTSFSAPIETSWSAPKPATDEGPALPEGTVIESPMVGTFYRAPSPGATPFTEVGKTIKPGETVCIVEAMKILNQIEAEVGGTIKAVLVEDGEPVEFGQPLFIVD